MKPHPGYRILWLVLHGVAFVGWLGLLLLTYVDLTWWVTGYIVAAALLEGVALARKFRGRTASGTWSWVTWAFIDEGSGLALWWRLVLTLSWVAWISMLWVIWFPLPLWFVGPTVVVFWVWVIDHFLSRVRV